MNKRILFALLVSMATVVVACSQPASISRQEATDSERPRALAAMVKAQAGFVYTADERGNSISVTDLATGQVKTIGTPITPHNVQASSDGRLLLAVGEVEKKDDRTGPAEAAMGGMERGRLLLFHTRGMNLDSALEVELGRDPAHVVVDSNDRLAYVTNSMDSDLAIVDLRQGKVISTVATGKMPHGLRMSPDGREIYIANVKDDSVSVIDVGQSKEVARIAVGKAPVQVGFTPDGSLVYVSLRDENSVAVVDTAQRRKIAKVPVGRNPIQVFVTPNGRFAYVANQGTQANPDNTVSVISTASNSVIATITTGQGAHGVVVSDDGSRVFITNTEDGTVSVIDTATQKVIDTFKVGKGPNGITFRSATR